MTMMVEEAGFVGQMEDKARSALEAPWADDDGLLGIIHDDIAPTLVATAQLASMDVQNAIRELNSRGREAYVNPIPEVAIARQRLVQAIQNLRLAVDAREATIFSADAQRWMRDVVEGMGKLDAARASMTRVLNAERLPRNVSPRFPL